jgi:hypothetical protein
MAPTRPNGFIAYTSREGSHIINPEPARIFFDRNSQVGFDELMVTKQVNASIARVVT